MQAKQLSNGVGKNKDIEHSPSWVGRGDEVNCWWKNYFEWEKLNFFFQIWAGLQGNKSVIAGIESCWVSGGEIKALYLIALIFSGLIWGLRSFESSGIGPQSIVNSREMKELLSRRQLPAGFSDFLQHCVETQDEKWETESEPHWSRVLESQAWWKCKRGRKVRMLVRASLPLWLLGLDDDQKGPKYEKNKGCNGGELQSKDEGKVLQEGC